MEFIVFLGFGFGFSVLCLRYAMIERTMVRDLMALDPGYRPRHTYSLDPVERTRNVREYRKVLPDGLLSAKLRHAQWALVIWAVLGLLVIFVNAR